MWNTGWTLVTIVVAAGSAGFVLAVITAVLLSRYA